MQPITVAQHPAATLLDEQHEARAAAVRLTDIPLSKYVAALQ